MLQYAEDLRLTDHRAESLCGLLCADGLTLLPTSAAAAVHVPA